MNEILIGDEWIKMSQDDIDEWGRIIEAEEKEKRIWRPLYTVIGYKDFKKLADT